MNFAALRDRCFRAIARVGLDHPWTVLIVIVVVVAAFGALLPGLGVRTSRSGLVSDEDPQQRRMNAFFERFGRPDTPLFVVAGGSVDERRQVVDELEAAIEADPQFAGRSLGRVVPADVAEIILLQQPNALASLRRVLPPGVEVDALVEGGLSSWLDLVADQLEANQAKLADPEVQLDPAELVETFALLEQLTSMAQVLQDVVDGRDPLARLDTERAVQQQGIDDKGYLVTTDGQYNLVTVFTDLPSDEGAILEPVIRRLRDIRDEVLADAPEGITADLTGLPGLAVDELRIVEVGLLRSSIATTVAIFLLCLALFRSVRQTIVALIPLLPGVLVTLGLVRLLYGHLNLITSSFVAVLLGLGIDFAVHLLARRNEEVRAGQPEREAVTLAMRQAGPGILTGAIITAAAFLTTATTEFTAYGELGIITALGLMIVVAATFFIIPPLMVIGRRGKGAKAPPEPPLLGRVPALVHRLRIVIVIVAAAGGIAGAAALPQIEFDPRYFSFLPKRTESARALEKLEYDAVASPVFAALTADSVEETRAMAEALRELDTVAGVQSPSDLLPPLTPERLEQLRAGFRGLEALPDFDALAAHQPTAAEVQPLVGRIEAALAASGEALRERGGQGAAAAGAASRALAEFAALQATLTQPAPDQIQRLARLQAEVARVLGPAWRTAKAVAERGAYAPTDLPPRIGQRFLSRDRKALALYAVPSGQFWDRAVAEQFAADIRRIDPEAVGLAMIHVEHGAMILRGFERAAAIAAVLILVLLVIDFRSLRDALLALLPTAVGWLWMLGILALLQIRFDVANIVALPLVLGIGIAFGVHVMHRVREAPHPEQAGEMVTVDELVRGTGGAITVAALTTMFGFAGLMLGEYGGMISLGTVMVIGIFACLCSTVFVLPSVLLLLKLVR